MIEPPMPVDENMRLMSLHSLRILDTQPEERFDRITRMAQRIFNVDICLVSLVDSQRQWFKSKQGLDVCETSRSISFCGHTILQDDVFVVPDASLDERFVDNPLVTAPPKIRFYAGVPIHGPDRYRVGTLCLIDPNPGELSGEDIAMLKDLGKLVEDEVALLAQSTVDDLTQVANRLGFNTIARHMLSLCRRTETDAEMVFFDLDGFKAVNDNFGHTAGDQLLQLFARLLTKCFRSNDVVARVGGDEFVVLMTGTATSKEALQRLDKLAQYEGDSTEGELRWSVGRVSFDPDRHKTLECMLADADTRMYQNKIDRRKSSA